MENVKIAINLLSLAISVLFIFFVIGVVIYDIFWLIPSWLNGLHIGWFIAYIIGFISLIYTNYSYNYSDYDIPGDNL